MNNIFMGTASGVRFDLEQPQAAMVNIDDIAWSLARQSRYLGHTKGEPYNVALHSVWVADYLLRRTCSDRLALLGLLHDAHEAYCGDIIRPMADALGPTDLPSIKWVIQKAVWEAVGITPPADNEQRLINTADEQALIFEAHRLTYSRGEDWDLPAADGTAVKVPLTLSSGWKHDYQWFLKHYHALCKKGLTQSAYIKAA